MRDEMVATLVLRSAVNTWIALEGQTAPHAREMRERMAYPAIGDYVAETSTVLGSGNTLDKVGKLLRTSWERAPIGPYDEYDAEDAGRDRAQRLVYEIETFDGRQVRVEGHMVAILTSIFKKPEKIGR